MTTAIAVVGGRVDRSRSTCFTPGGTLLTQRSSFNNMFNTGIVSLAGKKTKNILDKHFIYSIPSQLLDSWVPHLSFLNYVGLKKYDRLFPHLNLKILKKKKKKNKKKIWQHYPFSRTSRSHFMCAATSSANSLRVRFLRLSTGGCTWFCSFTEGLDACSRNWMISCTGVGSVSICRNITYFQSLFGFYFHQIVPLN